MKLLKGTLSWLFLSSFGNTPNTAGNIGMREKDRTIKYIPLQPKIELLMDKPINRVESKGAIIELKP